MAPKVMNSCNRCQREWESETAIGPLQKWKKYACCASCWKIPAEDSGVTQPSTFFRDATQDQMTEYVSRILKWEDDEKAGLHTRNWNRWRKEVIPEKIVQAKQVKSAGFKVNRGIFWTVKQFNQMCDDKGIPGKKVKKAEYVHPKLGKGLIRDKSQYGSPMGTAKLIDEDKCEVDKITVLAHADESDEAAMEETDTAWQECKQQLTVQQTLNEKETGDIGATFSFNKKQPDHRFFSDMWDEDVVFDKQAASSGSGTRPGPLHVGYMEIDTPVK